MVYVNLINTMIKYTTKIKKLIKNDFFFHFCLKKCIVCESELFIICGNREIHFVKIVLYRKGSVVNIMIFIL